MKEIYLLLVLIIVIFIGLNFIFIYINNKESLINNSKNNTVILIGDSVLNNSKYIQYGENSTFNNLKDILYNSNIVNYAEDGATIQDCFKQIDKIKLKEVDNINDNNLFIVVSCGGNDILNSNSNGKVGDLNVSLEYLQNKLKLLIKTIQTKFPNCKICVLNLYYPFSSKYLSYKPIIKLWNEKLNTLFVSLNNNYKVVNIASVITSPSDLVYDIEPSASGGKKVAICISNSV